MPDGFALGLTVDEHAQTTAAVLAYAESIMSTLEMELDELEVVAGRLEERWIVPPASNRNSFF